MYHHRLFIYLQAAILAVCLLLNGCGGDEWAYQTDRELKPGPGILSGEDGEFNLIGGPEKKEEENDKETQKSN